MDHNERARAPDQDFTPAPDCPACAIVNDVKAGDESSRQTADVPTTVRTDADDDDAVVTRSHELDGLLVVPRNHVSVLEDLPPARRARVLAAVRRATSRLRDQNPGSTISVVPTMELAGPEQHVCFLVTAEQSDRTGGDAPQSPAAAEKTTNAQRQLGVD